MSCDLTIQVLSLTAETYLLKL